MTSALQRALGKDATRDGFVAHFRDDQLFPGRRNVGMTGFYRNSDVLGKLIPLLAKLPPKELKILSAPCSVGCEPYSFVMLALAAGLYDHHRAIRTQALDLSDLFLQIAREGIYPEEMVKDKKIPPEIQRHFHIASKSGRHYAIAQEIKNRVDFLPPQDLSTFSAPENYDAHIMLNLLVQQPDPQDVEKTARTIQRLKPAFLAVNNLFIRMSALGPGAYVPYPHWHFIEKALRQEGYRAVASTFTDFPFIGELPGDLQQKLRREGDRAIIFRREGISAPGQRLILP